MEQKNYENVEQIYELIKNLIMKKVVKLLGFILLVTFTAKGQEVVMDQMYFFNNFVGVTAGIGLTSYTGSVSFYADKVDSCVPYSFNSKSGFETNVLFGLRAELKLHRYWYLYASLLYEERSAKFAPQDYTEHVYVSDAHPFELASFKQELSAKVNIFSITPMIKYRPFNFDFGIFLGPSFAFMVSDELSVKESITEPTELFFGDNGKRERTVYSGEIESKNTFLFDLKGGFGYGRMIAEQIKLSAEIFYVLPLTKVKSGDDWKISSIQFLVSCSYGF